MRVPWSCALSVAFRVVAKVLTASRSKPMELVK
jgi:hypothetical protein